MAIRRDRKLTPKKGGPQRLKSRGASGQRQGRVDPQQAWRRRRDVATLVKAQVEEPEVVSQILAQAAQAPPGSHWAGGVTEETVLRLVGEVKRELVGRAADLKRELRAGLQLIRLTDELRVVRTLRTAPGAEGPAQITAAQKEQAILRIEQEIARHAGTYAPEQHVHQIDVTQDKLDLLGAMSADEVREVIEQEQGHDPDDGSDDG